MYQKKKGEKKMRIDEKMRNFNQQIAELEMEINRFNEKYNANFKMGWRCERKGDYAVLFADSNFETVASDGLYSWNHLADLSRKRGNITFIASIDETSFIEYDSDNDFLDVLDDFIYNSEKNIYLNIIDAWELLHYVTLDGLSLKNDRENNFWSAIKMLDMKNFNNIEEWFYSFEKQESILLQDLTMWSKENHLTKNYADVFLGKVDGQFAYLKVEFYYCNEIDDEDEILYLDESETEIVIQNMIIELH